MIYKTVHLLFVCYTALLMIRILGSWVPPLQRHRFMHFVAHYTDPYLNLFRRFIPPIGGVLDLSPLLGFFALRLVEMFVLSLFR